MKNKKGVSLVEVVVAMAVIVVVSVTALSVALSTTRLTDKAALRFRAVNQIEDIVTLAENAESKDAFLVLLKKYFNVSTLRETGNTISVDFDIKDYNITVKFNTGVIVVSASCSTYSFTEEKSFPKSWGVSQ